MLSRWLFFKNSMDRFWPFLDILPPYDTHNKCLMDVYQRKRVRGKDKETFKEIRESGLRLLQCKLHTKADWFKCKLTLGWVLNLGCCPKSLHSWNRYLYHVVFLTHVWNKNLGRLWLAYTELQGDFYMLQLMTDHVRMWACSDASSY